MSFRQVGLGTEIRFTFVTGSPSTHSVIKDGVVSALSVEILPVDGTSAFSASFIPVETGVYDLIVNNVLIGSAEVTTKDIFSFLRNLEDQAFGGWEWNKTTKVMTIYRQDGSTLATYLSDDTLESAYSTPTISS